MSTVAGEPTSRWPTAEWNGLELAVRRLIEAREAWRRRAIAAEQRVRELDSALADIKSGALDPLDLAAQVERLTSENKALRERVDSAQVRVRTILQRMQTIEETR